MRSHPSYPRRGLPYAHIFTGRRCRSQLIMELLFWFSFAFVFYIYVGYPLLLVFARRVLRRPINKRYWEPAVSVVIAAYNERDRLAKKIQNCLSLDYPKEKLQIIISLDGSTDGSELLLRRFVSQGVRAVQSR